MEILRTGNYNIKKEVINLDNIEEYNFNKIKEASHLICEVMENYPVSTFDLITMLRKDYNNSLIDTYNHLLSNNYESIRCNCYYLAKVLKKKLLDYGINTDYITYKAHYFALNSGDNIIKEAHISLLYPTLKDGKIYYTIFDPGLKIYKPLSFYKETSSPTIKDKDMIVGINYDKVDNDYPYCVYIDGINEYSYTKNPHKVCQRFNPLYRTTNIDQMLYPISYKLLTGYKAIVFSKNPLKRAYITLYHLDKKIDFYDESVGIGKTYSYDELLQIDKNKLKDILAVICKKLDLNVEEIIKDIYFMIDIHDEFINTLMDKSVLEEYNQKKLIKTR